MGATRGMANMTRNMTASMTANMTANTVTRSTDIVDMAMIIIHTNEAMDMIIPNTAMVQAMVTVVMAPVVTAMVEAMATVVTVGTVVTVVMVLVATAMAKNMAIRKAAAPSVVTQPRQSSFCLLFILFTKIRRGDDGLSLFFDDKAPTQDRLHLFNHDSSFSAIISVVCNLYQLIHIWYIYIFCNEKMKPDVK